MFEVNCFRAEQKYDEVPYRSLKNEHLDRIKDFLSRGPNGSWAEVLDANAATVGVYVKKPMCVVDVFDLIKDGDSPAEIEGGKVVYGDEKKPSEICDKVFVYGTLKVGGRLGDRFNDIRKSSKAAMTEGELWGDPNFSGYPMMCQGEGFVHGEVHEFEGDFDEVLEQMDSMEGFRKHDPDTSLFIRALIPVSYQNGAQGKAWAYFFNNDPAEISGDRIKRLTDGIWKIEKQNSLYIKRTVRFDGEKIVDA